MKTKLAKLGAVLMLALLVLCLPAFALATNSANHHSQGLSLALGITVAVLGAGMVFGTVALTYLTPNVNGGPTLGGTVPPTATQAANFSTLAVQASTADGDTSIAIVHNWGLSTADLAAGYPVTIWTLDTAGTAVPVLTGFKAGSAANTLTITKASAAGSGGTILFTLARPHTIVR